MSSFKLPTQRGFHFWFGAVLGIPLFLVAVTAVFIAHDKALGLEDMPVSVSWLPGFGEAARREEMQEVKAYYEGPDGIRLLGTKAGIIELTAPDTEPRLSLGGQDIRAIAASPDGAIFAAGKMGLYRRNAETGTWVMVRDGDFHHVSVAGLRIVVAEKKTGLLTSIDGGKTWSTDDRVMSVLRNVSAAYPHKQTTLKDLVTGIHTGKAFFGKSAEWIWIDILGFSMAGLAITGVVLWTRRRRRQEQLAD